MSLCLHRPPTTGGVSGRRPAPTKGHPPGRIREQKHDRSTGIYVEIESGIQVASRWEGWRTDAAASNGSNRILSYGALLRQVMPDGRMEIPHSSRFRP